MSSVFSAGLGLGFTTLLALYPSSALAQVEYPAQTESSSPAVAPTDTPTQAASSGSPGSFLGTMRGLMNPDISLDGLFAFAQFNTQDPVTLVHAHDPTGNGFNFQALELTLTSNVDPYFRADANILFLQDGAEVEEAYGTTLSLPWNLQLKAGQFFSAFGRQNPTHPHAWDFADKPLVMGRFFGGDGLRNVGVQLSWLSPLPWYSELVGSIQNSTGETAVSFNPEGRMHTLLDGIALLRWNNFVSITDELLLNAGATFVSGANASGSRTQIYGADLLIRYRPLDSLSFIAWETESLWRQYGEEGSGSVGDWGMVSELRYRLPGTWSRWHVGLRYDLVGPKAAPVVTSTTTGTEPVAGDPDPDFARRWRVSPVVTFYPSEFSKIRLQYEFDRLANLSAAQQAVYLQFEFVIGSHGAHRF